MIEKKQKHQGPCGQQRQRRGMRLILRPSLLLMLSEGESHGYELYDQLESFGFESECLDPSIVYRELREMEELGWVKSTWDENSKGPKKRVYFILDQGRVRLVEWVDVLKNIQKRMDTLINRYKKLLKKE